MTFGMRNDQDYRRAGIPTLPIIYGFQATRVIIAASSVFASLAMILAAVGIGLSLGLCMLGVLSTALLLMAVATLLRPSEKMNFGLFKFASLYMFGSMQLFPSDLLSDFTNPIKVAK